MQRSYPCPTCRRALRYIPQTQNWYCDYCRSYPYFQQTPMTYAHPRPTSYDPLERMMIIGVVLLIPLIIIGVIIVGLTAPPVPIDIMEPPSTTPRGSLFFEESNISPGEYTGSLSFISEEVWLGDVEMRINDDSLFTTAILDPLVDGGTADVPGGMNCTFYDSDGDSRLSNQDTFRVFNGESEDVITIIYRPTMMEIDSFILI